MVLELIGRLYYLSLNMMLYLWFSKHIQIDYIMF